MAAMRRVFRFVSRSMKNNFITSLRMDHIGEMPKRKLKSLKPGVAGMCVAAGGAVAYYYYCHVNNSNRGKGLVFNIINNKTDLLPSLPAVAAKEQELEQILSATPPVWRGTSKLFRNLRDGEPHAGFKIAFKMFDADGNQMVDKKEFLVLQEIFRKKNEKKGRKGDAEKSAQLVLKDTEEYAPRSYWDILRRSTSQALFSDLAERAKESMMVDTTLLMHFFGKKGKAELNYDDFYRFMDNLQTEVLEIEFLTYSKGMTTISEEDFARILLRYTNVENISSYLDSVRQRISEEKGLTFDEFRSFFQFLNNLEDFAIAMQMYNFANRSIGQEAFRAPAFRHGADKNGFSLGFGKNLRQVFGDEKKYWFLPVFSSLGDGCSFPTCLVNQDPEQPSTPAGLNTTVKSVGDASPFPAKPLRESQSRLLISGQSWTESDGGHEEDKHGKQ
ncbi:Calcium uptake protein 3, mitochondrial [Acipenser ruthenus]|uniref:Calcium uptake protein 3, mitochondrial n=1 Tax=Acipenser ruthenus TaxID=7906 RepID=A0A444UIP0_ACIRT|nr:Calcium uptake protein 3, mitochondrial [Acipenser ruthenus]